MMTCHAFNSITLKRKDKKRKTNERIDCLRFIFGIKSILLAFKLDFFFLFVAVRLDTQVFGVVCHGIEI